MVSVKYREKIEGYLIEKIVEFPTFALAFAWAKYQKTKKNNIGIPLINV